MRTKNRIKVSKEEAEFRYANWMKTLIDIMKPQSLYLVGGRGVAKSTEILAERSYDVIYELPGGTFSWIADTYVNLTTNILPAIIEGWKRRNFVEGIHFVINKPPLPDWDRPWNVDTFDYSHTIFTHNGCKFLLKSLDRPSINAGISVIHRFGDEAKYLKLEKLNKSAPAIRGDAIKFAGSPYFMGDSFTTDMPDTTIGDDDWILDMKKNMNVRNVKVAIDAGLKVNELRKIRFKAIQAKKPKEVIENISVLLERWEERHRKSRYYTTFFYIVSSFANADILTPKYFKAQLEKLGMEEFKTAILSMHKKLEPGQMFYGNLKADHFYHDGYDYENFYDKQSTITHHSRGLRYVNHNEALDMGFDAGNMMSLCIGQEQPGVYRVLKNIFTVSPEWIRDLADKFLEFFRDHQRKVVYLWADRAAYQYRKTKEDFVTKLKYCIEHTESGKSTGWNVQLMNIGQSNITHAEEFDLMNEFMGGKNNQLPRLLIDAYECKELKSSMEGAKVRKNGKGQIEKVKTSEKLALHRLPMESTNMSDAFKYLMCRRKYLAIVKKKAVVRMGSVSVR